METLMQEINDLLEAKNASISVLKWENEQLRNENTKLKNDIEKYKENEVNRV